MSLYEDYARSCTILVPTEEASDEGGWKTAWVEGAVFINYAAPLSAAEVRRAEKDGLHIDLAGLVSKETPIAYNDYFRDNGSGETYRVVIDPDIKQAPSSATFDLKYFEAEKRPLP